VARETVASFSPQHVAAVGVGAAGSRSSTKELSYDGGSSGLIVGSVSDATVVAPQITAFGSVPSDSLSSSQPEYEDECHGILCLLPIEQLLVVRWQ
jgi:hypothetical protein